MEAKVTDTSDIDAYIHSKQQLSTIEEKISDETVSHATSTKKVEKQKKQAKKVKIKTNSNLKNSGSKQQKVKDEQTEETMQKI